MRTLIAAIALAIAATSPVQAQHSAVFTFTDQAGTTRTLDAFRGMPVVLTFVSAHCTDTCPIVNAQFASVQVQAQRLHLPIHLVTLTLDPEHDRASDMRAIAKTFGAAPASWTLGSGSTKNMHALMRRFGVIAQPGAHGYAEAHSTYVYLLDGKGRLVTTMLASTNFPAELFAQLQVKWRTLSV